MQWKGKLWLFDYFTRVSHFCGVLISFILFYINFFDISQNKIKIIQVKKLWIETPKQYFLHDFGPAENFKYSDSQFCAAVRKKHYELITSYPVTLSTRDRVLMTSTNKICNRTFSFTFTLDIYIIYNSLRKKTEIQFDIDK